MGLIEGGPRPRSPRVDQIAIFVHEQAELLGALVELHGGSLDLQSEVGTGTIATVRFPAEQIV